MGKALRECRLNWKKIKYNIHFESCCPGIWLAWLDCPATMQAEECRLLESLSTTYKTVFEVRPVAVLFGKVSWSTIKASGYWADYLNIK